MKKTPKEVPAKVYRLFADQIESQTGGLDYHEGELSVMFNNLEYVIKYEVQREYETVCNPDPDLEPTSNNRCFVSVQEMTVYDINGDTVTMTMDTDQISQYFDMWPCYED